MDPVDRLLVFVLIWSSGLLTEETDTIEEIEVIQLVGGSSRCSGELQLKIQGVWREVDDSSWDLADAVCRHLDCGSVVKVPVLSRNPIFSSSWVMAPFCLNSGTGLRKCLVKSSITPGYSLWITCSDSVRLVNSLCSGRLEVKSNQRWSSVCEDDFDQQDAEVVCRELGCGAPSVLQGALYGEVEALVWSKEFQCEGNESALLDCRSSGSDRNTCSSGKAVGLTCSGLLTEETDTIEEIDDIQLVGGSSRCSGELQVKSQGVWREVDDSSWDLKLADAFCRHLDCGSVVHVLSGNPTFPSSWVMAPFCLNSGTGLRKCLIKRSITPGNSLWITCSDSVRLMDSLCSGRLEVKSNQRWSSVCEDDFDQQDAEVVCRELGCGAPSVLQGALYGEVEAPMWTKEFQCEGHESALLDCRSSGSDRNTCSSGKAVGLTCSEPDIVQLVGGSSRCAGELEVKQRGMWRKVDEEMGQWNLKTADAVCRQLDCGSAVSTVRLKSLTSKLVWWIRSTCLQSGSAVRECISPTVDLAEYHLEVKCSDSVRLVNGNSLCSGRLEVKSNQRWSSVCEDDFDQQDAEVVCRELGCGAPSVLHGALYGEVEAPVWSKEFQCGGHESALLDCRSSGSDRNTCSSGEAVGLTCSEPNDIRLDGGSSSCVGTLVMKHKGNWKPAAPLILTGNLMSAAVVCRQLDCGSALSMETTHVDNKDAWTIATSCGQSESAIRECASIWHFSSPDTLQITCSDSVRLVNGNSLCSGRLEVKSNQRWSSVCEDDFDQQDAEVACRELGCGAPSALQGALYGEVEAPVWSKEFQCGGHESALLDCRSSGSDRNNCSPGKAVGLTCSEPDNVRLSGGTSHCDGTLEMKQYGEWRPVANMVFGWHQKLAPVVCRQLDCGSVVSTKVRNLSDKPAWWISHSCVQSDSIPLLRECLIMSGEFQESISLEVICSDILAQPNISFSPHTDGLSEDKQWGLQVLLGSSFTISCSILPQHPGGSFQLTLTNSATSQNYTQPAVNHSAHFLFSAADHTHQGDYSCVYHVHVFSHNFSSESQRLYVAVAASLTDWIIRLVLLVLMVAFSAAMFFYYKASRRQTPRREDNTELDYLGGAQDGHGEAEEAEVEGPE